MVALGKAERVAFIHATSVSMTPLHVVLAAEWPEAESFDLLDTSLTLDRDAGVPLEDFRERFSDLVAHAVHSSARGILFTCSAFGPVIDDLARTSAIPILKPNEPMFREALDFGSRIALLATHAPAVPGLEAEFLALAGRRGHISVHFADGALAALRQGREEEHDQLVAETARYIEGVDAIMLAHFSTSRALAKVRTATALPVLTAPGAAVKALRSAMSAR